MEIINKSNKNTGTFNILLIIMLFTVVSISTITYADCSGAKSFGVLAVSQNNVSSRGSLIDARLSLMDGSQKVAIITPPYVGITTQKSITNAMKAVDINNCDAIFGITENETNEVDGPSAGIMFSLVLYGLYNNITMPSNIYATGEIDESGKVMPIGGLYEKVLNLCRMSDHSIVITSKIPWLEYHIVSAKTERVCPGSKIIQVNNISEAINYAYYNIVPDNTYNDSELNSISNITAYKDYTDSYTSFEPVANEMIKQQKALINKLNLNQDPYIQSTLKKENIAINKGYYYTAANFAFNNYAELLTYKMLKDYTLGISKKDIQMLKNKADNIINNSNNIQIPKITDRNLEYIMGAEIRLGRAKTAANFVKDDLDIMLSQGVISDNIIEEYRLLSTAESWSMIGNSLIGYSPKGGNVLNESTLMSIAKLRMNEMNKSGCNLDPIECKNAKELYTSGMYGASAVEASFAMKTKSTGANQTETNLTNNLTNFEPRTLWGELYYSQAVAYKRMGHSDLNLYKSAKNVDDTYFEIINDSVGDNYTFVTGKYTHNMNEKINNTKNNTNININTKKSTDASYATLTEYIIALTTILIVGFGIYRLFHRN